MNETPWPDTELAKLAALGDTRADQVIETLAAEVATRPRRDATERTSQSIFPELLREVQRQPSDPEVHQGVGTFLLGGEAIDDVMDKGLVRHAQRFFGENGVAVVAALFHAALPEAYLGRRGVQVLDMTGELVSNWARRIQDTGQFLIHVLSPAPDLVRLHDKTTLSAGEFAAVAARRVRLTHAAVRWLLSEPDEETPGLEVLLAGSSPKRPTRWGVRMIAIGEEELPPMPDNGDAGADLETPAITSRPLNQEDLLATLGTFTTVTFAALKKLAVPMDDHHQEAFYHLWNVVAWHLGIGDAATLGDIGRGRASAWPDNNLFPLGVEEMDSLYQRLAQRLQDPTEHGRRLAKTLVQELTYPLPRPLQGAPEFIVRYFIGDEHADQLEVGRGGYAELLIRRTGALERVARWAPSTLVGRATFAPISQLVTRYALRAFVAQSRGSGRGVTIERPIAGQWGIQMGSEVQSPST